MPYLHLHLIIHVPFDPCVYVGVCQCVCVCVCGRNSSRRNALEVNPSVMNRSIERNRPPIALDLIQWLLMPIDSL